MNKINETSYFDYLEGLLGPQDKLEFEDYIAKNPDAKLKLDKLKEEEILFNNKLKEKNFEKIFEKYLNEINKLQKKLDNNFEKKGLKKNNLLDFVKNMFQPLWEIPIQAKGVVIALPVGVYFLVTTLVPMQIAQNQSSSDFFMQLANLNELQQFLPKSQYGDMQAVKLDNKAWNIEDITTNFKTRSAAQASSLSCPNNLDSKIIEIFPTDTPSDKKTLTYCSDIDKNNWRLFNIEFKKDKKPLRLNSHYKIIMDKNSVFLFPQESE